MKCHGFTYLSIYFNKDVFVYHKDTYRLPVFWCNIWLGGIWVVFQSRVMSTHIQEELWSYEILIPGSRKGWTESWQGNNMSKTFQPNGHYVFNTTSPTKSCRYCICCPAKRGMFQTIKYWMLLHLLIFIFSSICLWSHK